MASASISLLANSNTLPLVMPRASRVTWTGRSPRRFEMCSAVPSPFDRRVGRHDHFLEASLANAAHQRSMVNCSGPTPSNGAIRPNNT